ncbi:MULTISPECIES: hypothetical protein [Vibrio]|uniref:Uncharacterized protein n=2 Tax=Vibrio diazotrophicus TaxID=685 RepID=A0A2J8I0L6_VIBDI|nr:hypothetical protein [Vibrio diazotrophicus]PNI04050.1 hypothetical protein C1N32_15915 [Vibrio diazotrophicus]
MKDWNDNQKVWNGTLRIWRLVGFLVLISCAYWIVSYDYTAPPKRSIRIAGMKPIDANIKAWANYWVTGDECESYSYDMFGRKAYRGGKSTERFTQNYASDSNRYELRVPYQTYTDSQHCIVELRDITVEAYNAFDTVGFAQLRVYQAGTEYYNKPIALSSKIEAKDCDAYIKQGVVNKIWFGGLGCYFYFDGQKISEKPEYNAGQVYFDFAQFNDDTLIHYDIFAGENYRSDPLDPATGK